jgi:hypothetical protein
MPKIDKRNFQNLLEEKKSIAPFYTPEWDVADEKDTGFALLKLFTHMQEEIIGRLNRVPDKNFTAFLEMLGIKLMAAQPARAPVTFYLSEGLQEGAFVPAGTQVGTEDSDKYKALTFETMNAFYATGAAIEEIYCVDPENDAIYRYTDDVKNNKGFAIFEKEKVPEEPGSEGADDTPKNKQEHVLYLGHSELFNLKNPASITFETGSVEYLKNFIWEYLGDDDVLKQIESSITTDGLKLPIQGAIKEKEINGVKNRWIHCRAKNNYSSTVITGITIKNVSPTNSIPSDMGFYNNLPLDYNKEFWPFGKQPGLYDTFYIASKEAFSKKNSTIKITFEKGTGKTVTPSTDILLSWEYCDGILWRSLSVTPDPGKFNNFEIPEESGSISFDCPNDIEETEVNGEKNHWIRVRIDAGDYGKEEYVLVPASPGINEHWNVESKFAPPCLKDIRIQYSANDSTFLQHCLAYNNLEYRDFTQESKDRTGFKPFIPLPEKFPTIYIGFSDAFKKGNMSTFFSLDEKDYPLAGRPKIEWSYWGKAYNLFKNINRSEKVTLTSIAGLSKGTELLFEGTSVTETISEIAIIVDCPDQQITLKEQLDNNYTTDDRVLKKSLLEVSDNTEYLTKSDTLEFIAPPEQSRTRKFGIDSYWLMGALTEAPQDFEAPLIRGIYPNTVWVEQVETFNDEILGSGDGEKNKSYTFFSSPVISQEIWVNEGEMIFGEEKETLSTEDLQEIKDETGKITETWVRWNEVEDFMGSSPRSRHYIMDNAMGMVQFGDGEHGLIPPIGRDNIKANYKSGGGVSGNAMENEIKVFKASIAGIDHVINNEPAEGGSDTESLEAVFERGPHLIKHRERAVSREDFERIAKASSSYIARTKCYTSGSKLGLIVIPKGDEDKPVPSTGLKKIVKKHLIERSLNIVPVGSVVIEDPYYIEVTVTVEVIPESIDLAIPLEKELLKQLKEYLHPLTGGNEKKGWEFGRGVHISDIYAILESVKGVDHVENLKLNEYTKDVDIAKFQIVCSGQHRVTMKMGS